MICKRNALALRWVRGYSYSITLWWLIGVGTSYPSRHSYGHVIVLYPLTISYS
jgi:hypothetical protein